MIVLLNQLFLGDISKNQIFQRIFIFTLFCIIYSKPHEKSPIINLSEKSNVNIERHKIIVELKAKILSRLNLKDSPNSQNTFNWDNIPEEMKVLLNNEVAKEERKVEQDEDKVETIISPLLSTNSCHNNQMLNTECFFGTLPILDMDEILNAKLIAPISGDMATVFRNIVQYNITMNQYQIIYDLTVSNNSRDKVEIDVLKMFKDIILNSQNKDAGANITSMFITFAGLPETLPISQIIDINKVVLEVQYKAAVILNRSKRETNMCSGTDFFCCTEKLKVSLEELGWTNFIVAPKFFIINYCKGDCNNYLEYSSNHAKAMNLIRGRSVNERKDMKPCCVPYSFSNQTIMYLLADKSLKITTFTNFIAASCGCL